MNAVFHFSGYESQQDHAMANVRNLLNDDSVTVEEVVVVTNGDEVYLLTDDSTQTEVVASLISDGVTFRVYCNNMDR